MLLQLVRVVFRSRQRKSRRYNTLDSRIVGQVQEQSHSVKTAVGLKVLLEEPRRFHVHTHRSEHDRKVVFVPIVHIFGGTLH